MKKLKNNYNKMLIFFSAFRSKFFLKYLKQKKDLALPNKLRVGICGVYKDSRS